MYLASGCIGPETLRGFGGPGTPSLKQESVESTQAEFAIQTIEVNVHGMLPTRGALG